MCIIDKSNKHLEIISNHSLISTQISAALFAEQTFVIGY